MRPNLRACCTLCFFLFVGLQLSSIARMPSCLELGGKMSKELNCIARISNLFAPESIDNDTITKGELKFTTDNIYGQPRITNNRIVFMVLSARNHSERRDAIRETWAEKADNVYFVLGQECPYPPNQRSHCLRCEVNETLRAPNSTYEILMLAEHNGLVAEQQHHHDLLFTPEADEYQRLPHKLKYALDFAVNGLPKVRWIIKADDDMFIRIKPTQQFLGTVWSDRPILIGGVWWDHDVQHRGKWAEYPEYNYPVYPPFPRGSQGYAVNRLIAEYVSAHKQDLFEYQGEDVSLGIWLDDSPRMRRSVLFRTSDRFVQNQDCANSSHLVIGHNLSPQMMRACSKTPVAEKTKTVAKKAKTLESKQISATRIPRIMHFIHISTNLGDKGSTSVPDQKVKDNIQDWQSRHPEWLVRLWTNEEVRRAFPELMPTLNRIVQPLSWKANIIRYSILYHHGGVYMDTDVVPLQSLNPLVEALPSFTVCQEQKRKKLPSPATRQQPSPDQNEVRSFVIEWDTCDLACNAVIGAEPYAKALQQIVTTALANTVEELQKGVGLDTRYNISVSGPQAWTIAARENAINVLDSSTFYPCGWRDTSECDKNNFQDNPNIFAMHEWAKTWWKEGPNGVEEKKKKHGPKSPGNDDTGKQAETVKNVLERLKILKCTDSIESELHDLRNLLDPKPILTEEQINWILTTVRNSNTKPNLLVFGLGYDSSLWSDLNHCGRTAFVEDLQPWIDKVLKRYPKLEAHHITYQQQGEPKTSVATASDFFANPYLMKLPEAIDDECFDTVLLDAPMGYEPHHPGRHEAAYWTLQMVKRCASVTKKPIYVFVHDAQRSVENSIVEDMYIEGGGAVAAGSLIGREDHSDPSNTNLLRLVVFNPPSEATTVKAAGSSVHF